MAVRTIPDPGFAGDDGSADPGFAEFLKRYDSDPDALHPQLLDRIGSQRLLVPVVAILGEVEYDEQGLARDKSSDMAAVLITGRDGRKALLAFTCTAALQAWNPEGRPVPVASKVAALSAIQDQADALVVDIAGPVRFVIEGADLHRLASAEQLP